MGPGWAATAIAEVQKLLEVGFIMNKACLKDNYPLPKIDKLVDAIIVHAILSFMDAFLGYH